MLRYHCLGVSTLRRRICFTWKCRGACTVASATLSLIYRACCICHRAGSTASRTHLSWFGLAGVMLFSPAQRSVSVASFQCMASSQRSGPSPMSPRLSMYCRDCAVTVLLTFRSAHRAQVAGTT